MLQWNSQMRGQLASRITDLVDRHYGFEDLKKELVIQKNKDLCAKLRLDTAFYFQVSRLNNLKTSLMKLIESDNSIWSSLVPRLWSFHSEAVTLKSHALHFSYKAWDNSRQNAYHCHTASWWQCCGKFALRFN